MPPTTNRHGLSALETLTAWNLPHIVHGFMARGGGTSTGPHHSFNLAEWVADDARAVGANWQRWRASHPRLRVVRLRQVHGNQIRVIGCDYDDRCQIGDGMVTAVPGVALAIFTADCVPVLMVDGVRSTIAALHAGWRGVLANIAGAGVRAMVELGARPNRILAALGPSIGICCFEVDTGLAERFAEQIPLAAALSRRGRPGKTHLDLRAIIKLQLEAAGVSAASIVNVGPCTRCANDRFFSRRAALGAATGLQMSFIAYKRDEVDPE